MSGLIHTTTDRLEYLAWREGEDITIADDYAEVRIGTVTYRAPQNESRAQLLVERVGKRQVIGA